MLKTMGLDGLGWDVMGWDGIGWDGMGWDGHRAGTSWATSQTGMDDGHLSMPGDVDQVDRRTPVNAGGRRPGRLMDTCQ